MTWRSLLAQLRNRSSDLLRKIQTSDAWPRTKRYAPCTSDTNNKLATQTRRGVGIHASFSLLLPAVLSSASVFCSTDCVVHPSHRSARTAAYRDAFAGVGHGLEAALIFRTPHSPLRKCVILSSFAQQEEPAAHLVAVFCQFFACTLLHCPAHLRSGRFVLDSRLVRCGTFRVNHCRHVFHIFGANSSCIYLNEITRSVSSSGNSRSFSRM